ncbi:MAG: PAS domain-containing protein [Sporichthyaceae bacterium]
MAARPTRNTHRLAAILDNLPDGLLLVDAGGTIVNANARAVAAFGVGDAAALVGSALAELLPSLGRSGTADGWPADGDSRRVLARPPVGEPFGVEVTCSRVPWGSGEERLLVALRYGTDSTAEAELVRTGRAAQAVLRSTEEAICGVDRDGRVVLANPAAARLLGAKVSAIAGLDLHTMALHTRLDGTPYPSSESPIARTLRTGRRMQRRREVVWRQDGSPVPVELSTAPMRDGAEIVGAVLAFTDVTEQVEAERRRARLLETLVDEIAPALAQLQADPAHVDALNRLRSLVAETIDYEHLMTAQIELDLAPVQLGDIVAQAIDATVALAGEHGVELRSDVEGTEFVGDAARLTRTLAELLRAAVHAVASGAVLTVTGVAEEGWVRVAVTGVAAVEPGPRDNPLLRWLRPAKVRERGPDPDLALVQMVAEGHGGQFLLEVASDGSRSFVVELPTTPPTAARSARRHARGDTSPIEGLVAQAVAEAPGRIFPFAVPSPAEPAAAAPSEPAATEASSEPAATEASSEAVDVVGPSPNGAVSDPDVARRRVAQVLVWPRATDAVAEALGGHGASSLALANPAAPTVAVPDGAGVVLIDPVAGGLARRVLHELTEAASSAGVPVAVVVGLAEVEHEDAVTDPATLLRAAASTAEENLRVLLVEPAKVLAAALRFSLRRAGCEVAHAVDDAQASAALAGRVPDLVLRNLALADGPLWTGPDPKAPIPVIAYTSDDLTDGHEQRLPAGTTLLSLAPRPDTGEIAARIAGLVVRLADSD